MNGTALRRCALALLVVAISPADAQTEWRASSAAEQALDAAAFQGIDQAVTENFSDVQSTVVVLRGRVVYEFYRDGSPHTLRDQQSVLKSALSTLTGIALGQGHIASLDQPVLALVPEWAPLNSDPRASSITVRHLLTMTAGFDANHPGVPTPAGSPRDAWARPLVAAPGEKFAYDNAVVALLAAVIEKATGMPAADYARQHLVGPLAMAEPTYERTRFRARTLDMAKLGQLMLQKGAWNGKQLLPEAYATAATQPQNAGGWPASMPYGYMWWVVPSNGPRQTFMASGYAGQLIWVHTPLDLVVAVTSTVSEASQRRGQAVQLLRGSLYNAARQRAASDTR